MKRLALAAVGLAVVLLATYGPSVGAQPVASITLPAPGSTKQLYPGCNAIALTFPDGTTSQTVLQAVTPSGAVEAMWRHDAALNQFEGFSPAAPQASDLLTVNFLDPVWLCLPGTLTPVSTAVPCSPSPPPSPVPTATPKPATATPPVGNGQASIVFTGQGDKDTASFQVGYSPFAVKWTTQSDIPEYAGFFFLLYPEGETITYACTATFDGVGTDNTVCYAPAGRYWIRVLAANLTSWRIEVGPPPPTSTLPVTFTGRGDKDTPTFHVESQSFTVAWTTASGSPQAANFAFLIYPEGETASFVCTADFAGVGSDSTACHAGPGDFYAVVLSANLDSWSLEITQQ
jgi:hypothetical protein